MKPFRSGLVVGKFCPLHKGHEHLLNTAEKSCERLVIISYTKPEYLGCEVDKRRHWLKTLYPEAICLVVDDAWLAENTHSNEFQSVPKNDADEHVHRRFTAWLCNTVIGETVDAVFTSEDYGDGFARVVSDYQSATVKHICVDKARAAVPISGTRIREIPGHFRAFLSDIVYASFIRKAVFLGGESTGKSTLAQILATCLDTQFAAEYGRELWDKKNGALVYDDMLHIAQTQIKREGALAAQSHGWLFCDTSPLTTAFYSEEMFGKIAPELNTLSQWPYDITFLCAPDFEFVQDGTRQGENFRHRQHKWYVKTLTERQIDFMTLTGPVENRVQSVLNFIAAGPKN